MSAIDKVKDPVELKEAVDGQIVVALIGLSLSLVTLLLLAGASKGLAAQIEADQAAKENLES